MLAAFGAGGAFLLLMNAIGANSTTRAVQEFARNADLTVSNGGGKMRTQQIIESMNASALRSGASLLSGGVLSTLTKMQAER